MINQSQYNRIRNFGPEELKKWLIKNNLNFSDVMYFLLNDGDNGGPFCNCCGESQRNGENHDEECIWFDNR